MLNKMPNSAVESIFTDSVDVLCLTYLHKNYIYMLSSTVLN